LEENVAKPNRERLTVIRYSSSCQGWVMKVAMTPCAFCQATRQTDLRCQLGGRFGSWQPAGHDDHKPFATPPEMIQYAVWLYYCFSLSLRDVELILAARVGGAVSACWRTDGRSVGPSHECSRGSDHDAESRLVTERVAVDYEAD
jgi:hypothetical protein